MSAIEISGSASQRVIFTEREDYIPTVVALFEDGFSFCSDLCAVDYLRHPGRAVPDGVSVERFEVVVNLLRLDPAARVRVRCQVPEGDPRVRTITDLYPGADAMERIGEKKERKKIRYKKR